MTLVKEIIQIEDVTVSPDLTLQNSIKIMEKNNHGVVVIVENDLPIGILTERDLLSLIKDSDNFSLPTSLFGRKNIITVNQNRSLEYALHILIDNNIRRLVVVDNNGFFIGVITQEDILKFLEEDSYKTHLLIANILQKPINIITVDKNQNISSAFQKMQEHNIGSIVVQDENDTPIGILTERDIIKIINRSIPLDTNICKVMSKPVITVQNDLHVKDVIDFMMEKSIRRVLVMSGNKIEGLISFRDIAQNLKGKYGQLLESKLKSIKSTLNHIGESILEIYEDNNNYVIQWANNKAIHNFGKTILDSTVDKLFDPEDWKSIRHTLRTEGKCNRKIIKVDSMYFEMLCSYHFVNNKETVLLILRDVTEFENQISSEKTKREQLEKELNLLQSVIDQQETLIVVSDLETIIEVNKSFLRFFNVDDVASFEKRYHKLDETFISHKDFYSCSNEEHWINEIQKLPKYKQVVSIVDPKTIEPKAFTIQINPLDEKNIYFVITLTDITNIKLESQKHYYNATHDNLTKLYNRAYFLDTLDNSLKDSQKYGSELSVILFDIDHFKSFNDTYGHLKGDEVLKIVSKTTSKNIRKQDIIARWGGEEFIVLLPNTNLSTAELVAENLRANVEKLSLEGIENNITSSFGVAEYIQGDDRDSLVKRADDALYEAKDAGRNCVISK